MLIKIVQFNPINMNSNDWNIIHIFRKQYHDENTSTSPYIGNKNFEKNLISRCNSDEEDFKVFYIYDDGKIIGRCVIWMIKEGSESYKDNMNNFMFYIALFKKYRKKGLGISILNLIASLAEKLHKSMILSKWVIEEDGKQFLKHIYPKFSLFGYSNRLNVKDVNWKLIENWIKEGEQENHDVELLLVTKIPDKLLKSFCQLYTLGKNEAPRSPSDGVEILTPEEYRKREENFEMSGRTTETVLCINPQNEVIGLTEIFYFDTVKNFGSQNLTTVKPTYRGRKIGKWLKGKMLLHFITKYPEVEYLATYNAMTNTPILAINTKIGYKEVDQWVHWQMPLVELQEYFKRSNSLNKGIYELESSSLPVNK